MADSITIGAPAARPLAGMGVQADAQIYNDVNRRLGVTESDCAMWERRLTAMRPTLARVFLALQCFDPDDTGSYSWESPAMQRELRNLRVLREAGAQVNLCMAPWSNRLMAEPGREARVADLLDHLINTQGCDHIRWISLFNEPEGLFGDDSAEYLLAFGKEKQAPYTWDDYVALHRTLWKELVSRGLDEVVQLSVPDVVMSRPLRTARLQRAARDFAELPASFSFHHYGASYPGFYSREPSKPYAPTPDEWRRYRQAVGEDAELICWEYNDLGYQSNTWFPGVGPRGEDHLGSLFQAAHHTRKTISMLADGIDGAVHWCLGDVSYGSLEKPGLMYYGLWRFKWEGWIPRPIYYYFSALMGSLRRGDRVCPVAGLPPEVTGVAVRKPDGSHAIALVNTSDTEATLRIGDLGPTRRLRVSPATLPQQPDSPAAAVPNADLPLDSWEPTADTLSLTTYELTILETH